MIFLCSERLGDLFLSREIGRLGFGFVPRGWVICFFFPERLGDFFVPRGCVVFFVPRGWLIFLSQKVGLFFSSREVG